MSECASAAAAVSPPIVFQKRTVPAESCPHQYVNAWVKQSHSTAVKTICTFPQECSNSTLEQGSSLLSCSSDDVDPADQFFGRNAVMLDGEHGYSEYLYRCASSTAR